MDFELTVWVYLVMALAAFLTGFSKAGFGGMMGPMITILAAFVLPIEQAIGILLPILMIGDMFALATYWGKWDKRSLLIVIPGSVVTVILGSYFLSSVSGEIIKQVLCIVVLLFVAVKAWQFFRKQTTQKAAKAGWGVLAGSVAGFTSAIAHSGSPPISMFLITRNLQPQTLAATMVVCFATLNWIKLPSYLISGVLSLDLFLHFAWTIAFIPLGVWIGRKVSRVLKKERFEQILLVLLTITALLMLFE